MSLRSHIGERRTAARAGQRGNPRACVAAVLVVVQLSGCYRYVPVSSAAAPAGTRVAVALTDRGRVALAEPVGPNVRSIQGDVLNQTDSSVVLAVNAVQYFDLGVPARWAGERVEISRDHIAEFRGRQLSRTRTWLTIGAVVVGAVALAFASISGFGGDPGTDRVPGGNGDDQ